MIALLGLALAHAVGAVLLAASARQPLSIALRRPAAALVTLAVLHLASLGAPGLGLLAFAAAAVLALRRATSPAPLEPMPYVALGGVAAVALARPWVPTHWDELVWLGKARLAGQGFDAVVDASLDPAQHLIPAGYPTLWPAAVGWLTLGHDALTAHTLAASLLVLLCAAAALEAWWPLLKERRTPALALAAALAAPLVWVHLRSTYLDLPVGLLGLALLGALLGKGRRPPVQAFAFAIVLAGFKDEGVVHVVAATLAALFAAEKPRLRALTLALPAALAGALALTWRVLVSQAGAPGLDHALGAVLPSFAPQLARLLWLHATDVVTWGVFWPIALVALARPTRAREERALKWLAAANCVALSAGLISGSERMRAFAENGTLLDRLLIQAWPAAALALLLALSGPPSGERWRGVAREERSGPAVPD